MFTANIDSIVLKNLVVDFDDENLHEEDRTRYFHNQTLFPTMDVETIGSADIAKFNINYGVDNILGLKTFEFTPF